MRKAALFVLVSIFLTGCALPYRSAVFRQMQTSSAMNEAVHSMGVALHRNKPLTDTARFEIKVALDEQVQAHGIASYALEQYQLYQGLLGHAPLETQLNWLYVKTRRVTDVIQKHFGKGLKVEAPDGN